MQVSSSSSLSSNSYFLHYGLRLSGINKHASKLALVQAPGVQVGQVAGLGHGGVPELKPSVPNSSIPVAFSAEVSKLNTGSSSY